MKAFCGTVGAAFVSFFPVGVLVDPGGKDALRQLLIPWGSVSCAVGLIAAACTRRTVTKRQTYGPDGEQVAATLPVGQLKRMKLWEEEIIDLRGQGPFSHRMQLPLRLSN